MRKLNVPWLAGIVVGPIIFAGLAFLLHEFQMSRNASVFIRQAKKAQEEDRPKDAVDYLRRYVKLAPKDAEGLILYGFQLADLNSVQGAYLTLEKALRQLPDRIDVRRRIVDLSIKLGRFQDAKDHLEKHLLKDSPHDSELLEQLATCQFAQSDFKGSEASLVSAIEHAPDHLKTYLRLASLYQDKLDQPKESDDMINKMVDRNSDNPRAFQFRADWRIRQFFRLKSSKNIGLAPTQEATEKLQSDIEADIKRAMELAPDDADGLLLATRISQSLGQNEEARKFIQHGIDTHPTNAQFYEALADLEAGSGDLKAAAEALKRGVAAAPKNFENLDLKKNFDNLELRKFLDLKWSLANRLIDVGDLEKGQGLIQQLRTSKYLESRVAYLEGRILVHRNEWSAVIVKLEGLRLELRETPLLAKQVDFWLGIAYRETNSPDQSLASFRRAEALDPNWIQAKLAVAEGMATINQSNDAISEFRQILSKPEAPVSAMLGLERSLLQLNLSRAPEQRNWTEFDTILQKIEQVESLPTQVAILKAQRLIAEQKLEDAEKMIVTAREKNPDQIELWTAQINLVQNSRDWGRVENLIQEAEKQFGDTVAMRRLKGRLIAQREPKEKARDLLRPLSEPASDWEERQRLELASDFALLSMAVDDYEQSEKLATLVEAAQANNLPIRMLLLDIAVRAKKTKLMQRVLEEIRATTGEKAIWHYGQAQLLSMQGDETKDKNDYAEAISHLEKASVERPTWDRIHLLWAEIFERQGAFVAATEQYLKAISLGEKSTNVTGRALGLLLNAKNLDGAGTLLRSLRESQSPFTNEMVQAEVDLLIQSGRKDQALKSIERLAQEQRNIDPMWLGRANLLLEKYDQAENQFRAATEANRKEPSAWVSLVQTLVISKQPEKAAIVIEEAKFAIDSDLSALALAQCYEIVGNFELARSSYRMALDQSPKNSEIRRRWVEFLLRSNSTAQAEIALRAILKDESGSSAAEQNDRQWAQQRLVDALRLQGSREKLNEALKLINDQLKQNKTESLDDLRKKAQVLAMFPTRENRLLAIEILEKLVVKEPLVATQLEERRMLASLYQMVGDPAKSRSELRTIIFATKNVDSRSLIAYIQLCIEAKDYKDYSEAESYLNTLKKLAPDESSTADIEIQVLYARKKYAEIASLLKTIIARPVENKDPELSLRKQNWSAKWFATIASKLALDKQMDQSDGFNAEAAKIFKKLAEERPDDILTLAEFLAGTSQVDDSLKLFEDHSAELTLPQLQRAVRMVMKNPRATPDQLAHFQEVLKSRENKPDEFIALALLAADLLSWRGEYKVSADKFREVLRREKENVIALNNLAFLLALTGSDHAEAMRLITKAIEIGGPMEALLDTRGFVYIASGNFESAVSDFEKSASESESSERQFHAALAYAGLKNVKAALKSLSLADELGLVEQELHPIERAMLSKLRVELNLPAPDRSK